MKRKIGKAGIALIFGALSAIFGMVIGEAIKENAEEKQSKEKDEGHWIQIE